MSSERERDAKCPKCGRQCTFRVTEVLEPGDTAVEQLFRGKLNLQKCPQCGAEFMVEAPLVYKESTPPYLLFLEQYPEDGDIERLEQEVDNLATDVSNQGNSEKPQVRIVFSRAEFLEKIALRRKGFDDRLIEYAKLQLFRNTDDMQLSREQHRLLFDYSHSDDNVMSFLVFDRNTSTPVNMLQVPMDEFHAVELSLRANDEAYAELLAAFPGCYVSADRLL